MSISFAAALAGTVLAAVGTGLAIRLCARKPRTDMVAWVIALAGLTVALAAQAAGYRRGFVPTTFRATQLGAALIAPLALAWGMAELAARGLVARFAARLILAGLFVVAGVILATDVLSAQAFSQTWPAARDHFEFLPLGLLGVVAVVVVLTIIAALATTGLRSRSDPAWPGALAAVALAGVAALATQGLQAGLPANAAYPALTAIAAAVAWLAARRAAVVSVGRLRGGTPAPAGLPGYSSAAATTPLPPPAASVPSSNPTEPSPNRLSCSPRRPWLPPCRYGRRLLLLIGWGPGPSGSWWLLGCSRWCSVCVPRPSAAVSSDMYERSNEKSKVLCLPETPVRPNHCFHCTSGVSE